MKTQRIRFTALGVPKLPEGRHTDGTGLYIRVGRARRTWYTTGRGTGELRLGHWPAMGIAQARDSLAAVTERSDAGLSATPSARPLLLDAPANVLTIGDLLERYEQMRRRKGGKGVKSLDEATRILRNNLGGHLKRPAGAFSKSDLREIRDEIAKRAPTLSNRFLGYFGPFFRWAATEDLVPVNFVPDVLRVGAEVKRDRTLSREEIRAIWDASFKIGNSAPALNFGRMMRFLLTTGQRIGEAASMRHGDLLGGTWRQKENKASREHRLKLPALALEQVGAGTAGELCFPGESGGKIGAISKLKTKLDRASGIQHWRIHDLRRSFASIAQEISIPETSIRCVLNHQIQGVSGIYLRGEMDKQKSEALAAWCVELQRIVGARRAVS